MVLLIALTVTSLTDLTIELFTQHRGNIKTDNNGKLANVWTNCDIVK